MMDAFASCSYTIHILMKADIVVLRFCGTAGPQRGDKRRAWVRANDSYNIQNTRFCCLISNHKHIGNLKWHMCTCDIMTENILRITKGIKMYACGTVLFCTKGMSTMVCVCAVATAGCKQRKQFAALEVVCLHFLKVQLPWQHLQHCHS